MRAIPQLVSAPLNPIPIAEHFRRSHPPCEHSHGQCISCIIFKVVPQSFEHGLVLLATLIRGGQDYGQAIYKYQNTVQCFKYFCNWL